MVDVTEEVLREVYEPTFKYCSWATASEDSLSPELEYGLSERLITAVGNR